MKRDVKEIIDGLQFTDDMFHFDPATGEVRGDNQLNEEDMITVNACRKAIAYIKEKESKTDVLDKIQKEIEDAYADLDGYDPDALPTYVDRVLQVIDKYKESKVED